MNLNPEQIEAVNHFEGPCVVTSVPGSGKTSVLTSRVISLIKEKNISPQNILCLTFTNKAANEMKVRIRTAFENSPIDVGGLWISTFHRLGVAVLRKFCEQVSLPSTFTIYDSKDQVDLLSKIVRMHDYESGSSYAAKKMAKIINDFREDLCDYKKHLAELTAVEAAIVEEYLSTLDKMGVVDFSGILYKTWLLLNEHEKIAKILSSRFRFVLVDEMQDTNHIQYDILKMIAQHENLFVVADFNQAIYSFRNAKPENIDKLQDDFSSVKKLTLPQNYRSTGHILRLAQRLIRNNHNASNVVLKCSRGDGNDVVVLPCKHPEEEANAVVKQIQDLHMHKGYKWKDCAVLYRMNSLSRSPEIALRNAGIPYKVLGGFSFFDRSEVKTILSYLNLLVNADDTIAFSRAISFPKRGIGPALVGKIERLSQESNRPILECCRSDKIKMSTKAKFNLDTFCDLVDKQKQKLDNKETSLHVVVKGLIEESGYLKLLQDKAKDEPDEISRLENVTELISSVREFEESKSDANLGDYMQTVQLLASDMQLEEDQEDTVKLLTIHGAKGLEWKSVNVVGVEANVIPHYKSYEEGTVEEERRLLYVAITRCKSSLVLSHCYSRQFKNAKPSPFLDEINA